MSIKVLACPHCGAPIPPESGKSVVCRYCARVLVGLPRSWWARPVEVPRWEGRASDHGKPRVGLGAASWVLDRHLATGESCEVFLAHRDARLTQRVVMKLATDDGARLRRELGVVRRLRQSSAPGSDHFVRLLPSPVVWGTPRGDRAAPFAVATRWRPGFVHTAAELRSRRLDPRVAVWIGKRLLEQLAWLHGAGFVHGAVSPDHTLVHARDHGAVLVGWSRASWRHGRGGASTRDDIAQAVQVAASLLVDAPSALVRFLQAHADVARCGGDALAVHAALIRVSREALGRPRHAPVNGAAS